MPTCARIVGISDELVAKLEVTARANNPPGITIDELSKFLTREGINNTPHTQLSMAEAMPEMYAALNRGQSVITGVTEHAVVVRSVQKVGPGPRDWLVEVADPATGRVIQLGKDAWTLATFGRNTFITIP